MAKKSKMITGKVVNKKVFQTLISRAQSINADLAESRGDMGAFIKDAEETHGIHRAAFKLAVKLDRMEQAKLADFLRGFDLYREYLKLDDRTQGDMLDGQAEEDEAEESEEQDSEQDESETDQVNASSENEAVRPGVVQIDGNTVPLGEFQRRLEENNKKGERSKGAVLDDLTNGPKH